MSPTDSHPDKGSVLLFCSEQTPLLPRLEEVSAFDEALTSGKVYVLLFGLSIHSLFEGLGNCSIFDFDVFWSQLLDLIRPGKRHTRVGSPS